MNKLLVTFYTWQFNRRKKLFNQLLEDSRSGVGRMVQNRAMEMAMMMVMRWLDTQTPRILHCSVCPTTKGLRNIGGRYWGPCHADEAKKVFEESQKQEAEAKALENKLKSATVSNVAA